ncbi:hypothetical protein ACFZAM_36660 [Streptomyces sp. NPDC008079]|uniref:hypothetical protein n=1 Tax=Streptomyces sp. NPDC008079 TaxID=3364806 RepID=UPI0036E8CA40
MTQHQTSGVDARLRLFALLEAQGAPDGLVAALEAGAVAGAQSEVVGLGGMVPRSRGPVFEDSWDAGVTAVSEALVGIADRDWSRRGGRSARAAELAVRLADVRRGERAGLERLEAFVRQAVLPRTYPNAMERRRVLEALGEAGGLCNARTIEYATGDVIVCTREAGHYEGDAPRREEPEGWHKCNVATWIDDRPYNHPHKIA